MGHHVVDHAFNVIVERGIEHLLTFSFSAYETGSAK
jgi:hypothetical protein